MVGHYFVLLHTILFNKRLPIGSGRRNLQVIPTYKIESLLVELLESIKYFLVSVQNHKLVVNVGCFCYPQTCDVLSVVEHQAVSTEIREQIFVQRLCLEVNTDGFTAEKLGLVGILELVKFKVFL